MVRKNPKRKIKVSGKNLESVQKSLGKMNYAFFGKHSAVQICKWTKNAIRGERGCWKEEFYGISSSGCCQMSPAVMWCENKCLHCWRPIELNLGTKLPKINDPKELLEGIVEERKKLLMGFKGRKGINIKKFREALEPSIYTMSLSGEPTLYPKLGELFKEIRKKGAVSFLVTNGLNPQAIKKLEKTGLPTQITVSTNAPNKELFNIWHRSSKKNAWEEFLKTLDILKKLKGKVRRVVRLTLVKPGTANGKFKGITNMSEKELKEYSELVWRADPDFIHVKGFKSVGYARDRMGYDKQPWHKEVRVFAEKLDKELGKDYKIVAEDERSCVIMLAKKGKKLKISKV
jgi:tRNA wybutosine-synthesizing protein 1